MSLLRPLIALLLCLPLAAIAAPRTQPLNDVRDAALQSALERSVERLGLAPAVAAKHLSVALVDVADAEHPRFAGLNERDTVYSASLPKIAILLGAFARIDDGTLPLTAALRRDLEDMIRRSSNVAATRVFNLVGPQYLADLLLSRRYALYDLQGGGGLWVGKPYGAGAAYKRDPLFNLSHGASAYQVARFYHLLDRGQLVSPEASREMKRIMGTPAIRHKFVKAIGSAYPDAAIYRKSGTWRDYHSDSALIEHDGKRYILVALSQDPRGERWLEQLALAADAIIPPAPALLARSVRDTGGRGSAPSRSTPASPES